MGVPFIEPLADTKRWNSAKPLSEDELQLGLNRSLAQIDANMSIMVMDSSQPLQRQTACMG